MSWRQGVAYPNKWNPKRSLRQAPTPETRANVWAKCARAVRLEASSSWLLFRAFCDGLRVRLILPADRRLGVAFSPRGNIKRNN